MYQEKMSDLQNAKNKLILHLVMSSFLYAIFAYFDMYFTLKGINGDAFMEGNPIIRNMMLIFGLSRGLIIVKSFIFIFSLVLSIIAFTGINKKAPWVYYLALTKLTRNWMKHKKRYWVAFIPLYLVALSQGIAALSWVYLMIETI